MDAMQFRGYVFPHNPQSVTVSAAARVAVHHLPGVGEVTQDMGPRLRVVRCKGCFFGATPQQALARLRAFSGEAAQNRAGLLYVPGMDPFLARLEEFVFEEQGDGRIIPYTMTFWEAGAPE